VWGSAAFGQLPLVLPTAFRYSKRMDETVQLDLDFHGVVGDGLTLWQADRAEVVRRVATLWGVPLNRTVRLKLWNVDGEFTGRLTLESLPPRLDRRLPLTLRLGRLVFQSAEIEACAVTDCGGQRQARA